MSAVSILSNEIIKIKPLCNKQKKHLLDKDFSNSMSAFTFASAEFNDVSMVALDGATGLGNILEPPGLSIMPIQFASTLSIAGFAWSVLELWIFTCSNVPDKTELKSAACICLALRALFDGTNKDNSPKNANSFFLQKYIKAIIVNQEKLFTLLT